MQLSVPPQSYNSNWLNTKKLVVLLFVWCVSCALRCAPFCCFHTRIVVELRFFFLKIRQINGKILGLCSTKLISYEIPRNCAGFFLPEILERTVKRFISHLTIFFTQQGTVPVDAANKCVPKCRSASTQWRGTLSQMNHDFSYLKVWIESSERSTGAPRPLGWPPTKLNSTISSVLLICYAFN